MKRLIGKLSAIGLAGILAGAGLAALLILPVSCARDKIIEIEEGPDAGEHINLSLICENGVMLDKMKYKGQEKGVMVSL